MKEEGERGSERGQKDEREEKTKVRKVEEATMETYFCLFTSKLMFLHWFSSALEDRSHVGLLSIFPLSHKPLVQQ